MKKIITIISLGISSFISAQNITLDELIILRKKSLVVVEETLSAKGWSYIKGEKTEYEIFGSATFAYKKSSYDDKAQSFITYYYSEDNNEKRLSIQIVNKATYNAFLNRVKALGCKLINSEISDGSIIKTYKGQSTTIKIGISTTKEEFSETTRTYYSFLFTENEKFDKIKDDLFVNDTVASESKYLELPEPSSETVKEIISSRKIEKDFFIGKWSCDNFSFTIFPDGKCITRYSENDQFKDEWGYIANRLLLGSYKTLYIISKEKNSFKYTLEKNGEIHYAYRVGN